MNRYLILYKTKKTFTEEQVTKINQDLEQHRFKNVHENMYLGDENTSEAHATVALQWLTYSNDWFYENIENIRIMRVAGILDATFIARLINPQEKALF